MLPLEISAVLLTCMRYFVLKKFESDRPIQALLYCNFSAANAEGGDMTAQICRLICTFVACIQQKQVFISKWLILIKRTNYSLGHNQSQYI